jgi:hypothetical protein
MQFDELHWSEAIKRPDWYIEFNDFAEKVKLKIKSESEFEEERNKKFRYQVRHFFEEALEKNQVALGLAGEDFDSQRQAVDTIVIHHTSNDPGYRLSYLNAVHLLSIYVPAFVKPPYRGQPIWSGHFHHGQQVFWGYHWLMRMDGSFEHLLQDDQIGWHSGNWDTNKRSIGICLDNDYEKPDPIDEVIQKLARHIRQNYPSVKKIIGHCEVRPGTICPGGHFLDAWKPKLLQYLH